jgi:N-sulfoglucosamine sulfohydrolase
MPRGLTTLPAALKKAGYRTGIMGKLHVNPAEDMPFDYKGIGHGATRDVRKPPADFGKFLDSVENQPFFFYLNVADAHTPFTSQVDGFPETPLTAGQVTPWPWLGVNTPQTRARVAGYYNCVQRVDTILGRVLDVLEKRGLADNTLVLFIGDHGPAFCRGKTTCYEAGLRIPFVVRWPGMTERGAARDNLVSTVDIMPTFLSAAGTAPPPALPGASLLPVLRDGRASWRTTLCAEFATHGPTGFYPRRSIRDTRYKLIWNGLAGDRECPNRSVDGCPAGKLVNTDACKDPVLRKAYQTWFNPPEIELYDLDNDPAELTNLADFSALEGIRKHLLAQLATWQNDTDDPLQDPRQLKALTEFQDRVTAEIRQRVAEVRRKAEEAGAKAARRDVQRASAIKPEYYVPPRPQQ